MDEIHPAKHRESKNADQFMDEFVSLSDSTQDNKASMKKMKCILKNTHRERKHKDKSIVVFQYVCRVADIHEATAHERMNFIHQTLIKHSNKKFIIVQFVVFCTFYAVDSAQSLMQIVLYSVTPSSGYPKTVCWSLVTHSLKHI